MSVQELAKRGAQTTNHIDALRERAMRLMESPEEHLDDLAIVLPEIWRRAAEVANYARLIIGRAVDDYCRLRLWQVAGYDSFKEVWQVEGDPSTEYATVKGWQYASRCQRLAGLTDMQASIQPIGKLLVANATLRERLDAGDPCTDLIADLKDPEVTAQIWGDRHSPGPGPGPEAHDRVTINTSTGAIMLWLNRQTPPVGIPLGRAIIQDERAEEGWNRVVQGKVSVRWA